MREDRQWMLRRGKKGKEENRKKKERKTTKKQKKKTKTIKNNFAPTIKFTPSGRFVVGFIVLIPL